MTHERSTNKIELLALLLLVCCVALLSELSTGFSQGPNNRNVSVDTQVNITGSAPEILRVTVPSSITLGAGAITSVTCNVSIRDYNGFADVSTASGGNVNATLFRANYTLADPDDNVTLYRNSSCAVIPGQQDGAFVNYTCSFGLNYYAMNGSWNCTVFVNDSINLRANSSNLTSVNLLLALNVTTLIDYGQMAIGDTSSNQEANVTNLGNHPINVTVRGYGVTIDDGLSMACEQGNISVGRQHFASNSTAAYAEKQALASAYTQVLGLTVRSAVDATRQLNTTYWQLRLDQSENAFGICNGTIIFQAEAP